MSTRIISKTLSQGVSVICLYCCVTKCSFVCVVRCHRCEICCVYHALSIFAHTIVPAFITRDCFHCVNYCMHLFILTLSFSLIESFPPILRVFYVHGVLILGKAVTDLNQLLWDGHTFSLCSLHVSPVYNYLLYTLIVKVFVCFTKLCMLAVKFDALRHCYCTYSLYQNAKFQFEYFLASFPAFRCLHGHPNVWFVDCS